VGQGLNDLVLRTPMEFNPLLVTVSRCFLRDTPGEVEVEEEITFRGGNHFLLTMSGVTIQATNSINAQDRSQVSRTGVARPLTSRY
jgi:hypothetical protein